MAKQRDGALARISDRSRDRHRIVHATRPLDSLRHSAIIDITRTGPPVAAGWVGATDPNCSGCSSLCPEQKQQEVEDGAFPIRQIPDN